MKPLLVSWPRQPARSCPPRTGAESPDLVLEAEFGESASVIVNGLPLNTGVDISDIVRFSCPPGDQA